MSAQRGLGRELTMPEAQAAGLCWLARQRGLPPVHSIRMAVAQLHPLACGWCDWPLPELLRMLGPVVPRRDGGGVAVSLPDGLTAADERAWRAMPPAARLAALRLAQGAGS